MDLASGLMRLAHRAPWLVEKIQGIEWLDALLNGLIIDGLVTKAATRPLPYTLWTPTPIGGDASNDVPVDYVSWTGLVDRRFTGRHLPPADEAYQRRLPELDEVLALYRRETFKPSTTTSALLCFFAQWFTDSVLRTNVFDRRLNWSNHEIDLCEIYGLDATTTALLRTKAGGRLKTSGGGLFPSRLTDDAGEPRAEFLAMPYLQRLKDGANLEDLVLGSLSPDKTVIAERKKRLYATGLERGNSTLAYVAISTVFIREHNRLCGELEKVYPGWDDDRLFETARNVNIMLLLTLTINEYINQLGQSPFKLSLPRRNFAERTRWYRANRIAIEFSLLYRWHSLTPEPLVVGDRRLANEDYRFNNALLEEFGIEAVIAAASRQPAGRLGMGNNPAFLWDAEAAAHKFARAQRVRPLVEYQAAFKQSPAASFAALAPSRKSARTSSRERRVSSSWSNATRRPAPATSSQASPMRRRPAPCGRPSDEPTAGSAPPVEQRGDDRRRQHRFGMTQGDGRHQEAGDGLGRGPAAGRGTHQPACSTVATAGSGSRPTRTMTGAPISTRR